MPFSSHQVNSMITGQAAMFGNLSNFSNQIGPGGQPGAQFSQPMYDPASFTMPPPLYNSGAEHFAHSAMSMGMGAARSALPIAALAGSFLPGATGRAFGMLDPTWAGLSGFARGAGLMGGIAPGSGLIGTAEGMLGNVGRIASGGIGNIARAGISGLGAGMASFLPAYALTKGIGFAVGQAYEGMQHTHHVQDFLQRNMRFLNQGSETGYGFSRASGADIAKSIRDIARGPGGMMTSTGELTAIMEQGVQGGLFRVVQDAQTFQKKFRELTDTLKVVAKTMNTSLAGAMPFLMEARRMGFWTPGDIIAAGNITRSAASAGGMSVAEAQQAMGQGAAMARSVGASGASGALGMQRSLSLVGGGLRSGAISEQWLQEATGLQGSDAVRAFSETMQAGATRFATSRTGRWMLAALANKGFTGGFDKGKLAAFMSGDMSVGDIQRTASKNVAGRGNAAAFLMAEEDLRGEMLSQGPMGQVAFIRGALGDRLQGGGSMDKYVTRRLIQRYLGVNAKTADIFAELARNQPRIMRENAERDLATKEQEARDHEIMMNHSFGGLMRKIGHRFENTVFLEWGAKASQGLTEAWAGLTDRIWGRPAAGSQVRGITSGVAAGIRRDVMGGRSDFTSGRTKSAEEMERSRNELERAAMAALSRGGVTQLSGTQGPGISMGGSMIDEHSFSSLYGLTGMKEAAQLFGTSRLAGERAIQGLLGKDTTAEQRKALKAILEVSRGGGAQADQLAKVMGGLSSQISDEGRVAYSETIKKRMGALVGQIGGGMDHLLSEAASIKGKGGASLGVEGTLRSLFDKTKMEDRKPLMEKLASQIAEAGPEAAHKLLGLLPQTGEAQGIRDLISKASEASEAGKIQDWGGKRGRYMISKVLREAGSQATFGRHELAILQGKDAKARDAYIASAVSGMDPALAEATRGMLGSLSTKGGSGAAGTKDMLTKMAAMLGLGGDKGALAPTKTLSQPDLGNQLGQRGSMTGIHDTLTRMLNLQEEFYKTQGEGMKGVVDKTAPTSPG